MLGHQAIAAQGAEVGFEHEGVALQGDLLQRSTIGPISGDKGTRIPGDY